ncbi:Hypothetical predicted protein [Cloeon dipterum]|uniref:Caspase family p20 domain-containing protein n=1 Tax=Cloeon dipterum TaxID=197152 RepID=A0A8S1BMC3_9INSE|nr:Hypothetical predicted protein [Cloeon dipterum]
MSIKTLENTLENYARIYETSGTSKEVQDLLCKEKEFRKKFHLQDDEEPELLIVYILTHGDEYGILETHHEDDFFLLSDLYANLQQNPILKNALKLIFVHACRGDIIDGVVKNIKKREKKAKYEKVKDKEDAKLTDLDRENKPNLNSVQVTVEPNKKNFITFFSSVERQDQYTVFIISAYAGWGKSVLAEAIANKVQVEKRVAILDLRKNSEFHKALIRTKEYRELFKTYWKMKGKNCFFDMPQFIVLDNIDDLIDEYFLKMVAQLATDKVGLLISTRPQNKDILEMHLEGICPVTAISMDTASREKQIDFLHRRIGSGVNEDKLQNILNYLDYCTADDLVEKLSALEKVASYPKLTDNGNVNIYELSEHVFDCTVRAVLHRAFGLTDDKSGRFKELRKEHERQLSAYSNAFFTDKKLGEEEKKSAAVLDDYGIAIIIKPQVMVLSVTLAAYLCVSQGLISTEEHLKKVPKLKHLKILRIMLLCKRKIRKI